MKKTEKKTVSQMLNRENDAVNSQDKLKRKKTLKKAVVIVAAVLVILVAVFVALGFVSQKLTEEKTYIKQISEVYPTYTPFPAEWNVNLSQDADYLSLNTNIMYGKGEAGSLYSLEDFYETYEHEGQSFFAEYFRILREGDSEKYKMLFSEDYKKIPQEHRFEKNTERAFPPQRVYDIVVRELGRSVDEEKNVIYGVYCVDYKIDKNNNLFRNDIGYNQDIGSNTSRPLYFEIVTYDAAGENEKTLISNIYTESSVKAHTQQSIDG